MQLIQATIKDIDLISELADKIWRKYYPSIISSNQIDYMLEKMYSQQSLMIQMNEKKHIFYLIKSEGKMIGFISVNRVKANNWFLNKFYILTSKASKGIGSKAFLALIKKIDPKTIELTVNRQNYKAINFYFKNNFTIQRVADFDIGNGYVMNDFLMGWKG